MLFLSHNQQHQDTQVYSKKHKKLLAIAVAYHFKASETLQKFTIPVLQPMCLIDDRNPPVNSTQLFQVGDDHFIRRYQ